MIKFKAKIREQDKSLIITIPYQFYRGLNKSIDLKKDEIVNLTLEKTTKKEKA